MKSLLLGAAVAGSLLAPQARASTQYYNVSVTGSLLTQGSGPDDPVLKVGDKVTLTARFSDRHVIDWGDTGYKLAGAWVATGWGTQTPLPADGEEFWRVDAASYQWNARSDIYDGTGFFFEHYSDAAGGIVRMLAAPIIIFKDGKVAGLGSYQLLSVGSVTPMLTLGHSGATGSIRDLIFGGPPQFIESYSELHFDNQLVIEPANGAYGNFVYTPGFTGVWDFEHSYAAIPEPWTWALMLMGFGVIGTSLRKRRLGSLAASIRGGAR